VSEGVVTNIIKDLIDNNLITKTKVRRQNHYSLNISEVQKHADIRHLLGMIASIPKGGEQKPLLSS